MQNLAEPRAKVDNKALVFENTFDKNKTYFMRITVVERGKSEPSVQGVIENLQFSGILEEIYSFVGDIMEKIHSDTSKHFQLQEIA